MKYLTFLQYRDVDLRITIKASQVVLVVKNHLPTNEVQETGDMGLISGSGRCPGDGNSNSLQDSCLGNPMDRGAWWPTVHGVAKSRTRLSTNRVINYDGNQSM